MKQPGHVFVAAGVECRHPNSAAHQGPARASRPFSGGEVTSEERLPGPLAEESVSAVSRPTAEEVRDSSERQHDDPAHDGERRE
jgi:hypothetical protein